MLKKGLLISCLMASAATHAAWQLDAKDSNLHFVSTKKSSVSEIGEFKQYQGSISNEGDVQLEIDLTSVNTNITIRDERLNKYLFQTDRYPKAQLSGRVDLEKAKKLSKGQSITQTISLNLSLHGITAPVSTEVAVFASDNGYIVSSVKPIVLNATKFGLNDGIGKLKELAKLDTINISIPVNFKFTFIKK